MIAGVTMKREVDEATGLMGTVIIEHKEDLHPQIVIVDDKGEVARELLDSGRRARHREAKATRFAPARCWPRRRARVAKTKDITGGLPRVAELFEARRPKDAAEIAKIDGIVEFGGDAFAASASIVHQGPETGAEEEHLIPIGKHVIVVQGRLREERPAADRRSGRPARNSRDLRTAGFAGAPGQRSAGSLSPARREINDKHIEIIVRQMLRKVRITEPGDTALLWGDQIDKLDFEDENAARREAGRQAGRSAAGAARHHQGLARNRQLHLSAASFQDTTRVLTEAATLGKVDHLRGFKENVIMGHIIPAGTGFPAVREIKLVELGEQVGTPLMEEPEAQPALG